MKDFLKFPLFKISWIDKIILCFRNQRKIIVRLLWCLVTLVTFAGYAASVPDRYNQLLGVAMANQTALAQLNLPHSFFAFYNVGLEILTILGCFVVATMITWHKSESLFACFTALMILLYGVWVTRPMETLTPTDISYYLLSGIRALEQVLVLVFCYTIPTGRFVPRWTLFLAIAWLLINGFWLFFPTAPFNGVYSPAPHSPLPFPVLVFSLLWYSTGVFSQIYRYKKTSSTFLQCQQNKWIMFGVIGTFVGIEIFKMLNTVLFKYALLLWYLIGEPSYYCVSLLMPLSFGVAILLYQLWDINIIINRALVYAGLTASVIGIYVLIVGGLGAVLRIGGNIFISLIATGITAVLFQPLRERFQLSIDRLMYGERDNPYKVLTLLGTRLEATLALNAVIQTIIETVASALKLPYVAIDLKQEDSFKVVEAHGYCKDKTQLLRLPLQYQTEVIGHLILSPRSAGEAFTPPDNRLLNDLIRHAGIAIHAVRLTTDLQRSRERLVMAREEERRRLQRDLHDGLSPALGALILQVGAVSEYIEGTPPDISLASNTLMNLEKEIKRIIVDVRQIVYGLRPPELDEFGLSSAMQKVATRYNLMEMKQSPSGGKAHPHITVDTPKSLPFLSAAIEVALFRIVQEAVENVYRHAHAQHCLVRLTVSEHICVDVIDDGCGIPTKHSIGVGLLSMHERTAELGGICTIESVDSGGTHIRCTFPLLSMFNQKNSQDFISNHLSC